MADIFKVFWSKKVAKQINQLPENIGRKFFAWVTSINLAGLRDTRKSLGFHDEPLKGSRLGQRSVRLNRAYCAIYKE